MELLGELTDILPRLGLPMLPPIGRKNTWVCKGWRDWRIQIKTALHDNGAISDRGVFQDGHGRHAIWASTMGQSSVLQSKANVKWHTGIQTESLMHSVLICAVSCQVFLVTNRELNIM